MATLRMVAREARIRLTTITASSEWSVKSEFSSRASSLKHDHNHSLSPASLHINFYQGKLQMTIGMFPVKNAMPIKRYVFIYTILTIIIIGQSSALHLTWVQSQARRRTWESSWWWGCWRWRWWWPWRGSRWRGPRRRGRARREAWRWPGQGRGCFQQWQCEESPHSLLLNNLVRLLCKDHVLSMLHSFLYGQKAKIQSLPIWISVIIREPGCSHVLPSPLPHTHTPTMFWVGDRYHNISDSHPIRKFKKKGIKST